MKPTHTILHISDLHFVKQGTRLHKVVDADAHLSSLFRRLRSSGIDPDALVFTGDLTNDGEREAYDRLREMVEPVCKRYGAEAVWVMGNHDSRPEFRQGLLGASGTDSTVDYVVNLNGLRIIVLDSTVPGHHHGEISEGQYEWLTHELQTRTEHGTLLALHHPPVPTPLAPLELVELKEQNRLAAELKNRGVRGILAGHLHYSTSSTVPGGIPVSVAGATCYTHDPNVSTERVEGVNGAQSFNLVQVYLDRIVHSVVPIHEHSVVTEVTMEKMLQLVQGP